MNKLCARDRSALLMRHNILVMSVTPYGVAKCSTPSGERIYTVEDLRVMAEPGVVERFKAWVAGYAA